MIENIIPVPQYKFIVKRKSLKLNLESLDKQSANNIKNATDKYYFSYDVVAAYTGELNDDGSVKNDEDYYAWKDAHPDIFSKATINNIVRAIKNDSVICLNVQGTFVNFLQESSILNGADKGFTLRLTAISHYIDNKYSINTFVIRSTNGIIKTDMYSNIIN